MTDSVSQDHYYMQTALNLSLRGQGNAWPNPSVGTIVVKNQNVISRGWTQPKGKPHAEIVALKKNKKLLKDRNFIFNIRTMFSLWQNISMRQCNY